MKWECILDFSDLFVDNSILDFSKKKKITKIEVFPPSLVYGNSKKDNSHKNILEGGAELQWVPKPGTGRRIHFYQDKTKMLYHNIWKFPCCFGPPQHPLEGSPGESLTPDPGP